MADLMSYGYSWIFERISNHDSNPFHFPRSTSQSHFFLQLIINQYIYTFPQINLSFFIVQSQQTLPSCLIPSSFLFPQASLFYCLIILRMQKTFDYYRSTNPRLAASLDQQDLYSRYLSRIDHIVSRKPSPDLSTTQYSAFLSKCKDLARTHHSNEHLAQLATDNQILLTKIVNAKRRKEKTEERYVVAFHEKRLREQARINEENRKIALRVVRQEPTLDLRASGWSIGRESPRRTNEKTFYESRVKQRKLPKLVQMRV